MDVKPCRTSVSTFNPPCRLQVARQVHPDLITQVRHRSPRKDDKPIRFSINLVFGLPIAREPIRRAVKHLQGHKGLPVRRLRVTTELTVRQFRKLEPLGRMSRAASSFSMNQTFHRQQPSWQPHLSQDSRSPCQLMSLITSSLKRPMSGH